jgi:DivIVA domain-containing protein
MLGEVAGRWPDANGDARPLDGHVVRATAFLRCDSYFSFGHAFARFPPNLLGVGRGYAASEVDELLRQVAAELDAGHPVRPLVENVTLRRKLYGRRYDIEAVDWFLGRLLLRPGHTERGGTGADPWRELAVAQLTEREASGTGMKPRPGKDLLRRECETAWRDFGQQPGTYLQWGPVKSRFSGSDYELRTAEQQTIASSPARAWRATTVSVGGRSFTQKEPAVRGDADSWPPGIAGLAARSWRDCAGHFAAGTMQIEQQRSEARRISELVDETGTPILRSHGENYARRAYACITFPDQRWLRFLVRGTRQENAIMTAVDQAGNRVARYRMTNTSSSAPTYDIAIHPDRELTDELILAIATSASWVASYFVSAQAG